MVNAPQHHPEGNDETIVAKRRGFLNSPVMYLKYLVGGTVATILGGNILNSAATYTAVPSNLSTSITEHGTKTVERVLNGGIKEGGVNFLNGLYSFVTTLPTALGNAYSRVFPSGLSGPWNLNKLIEVTYTFNPVEIITYLGKVFTNLFNNPVDMVLALSSLTGAGYIILVYFLKKWAFKNTIGFLDARRIDTANAAEAKKKK